MAKLIRDRIPEDMKARGYKPELRQVQGGELLAALLEKLVEEAQEVRDSCGCLQELGDVYTVLKYIAEATGYPISAVQLAAHEKTQRLGGFSDGLIWVNNDDTSELAKAATEGYRKAEEEASA
jgi:predicted house-cleaning noncanonical NTP pyrophosphatase (MazG superfamily)